MEFHCWRPELVGQESRLLEISPLFKGRIATRLCWGTLSGDARPHQPSPSLALLGPPGLLPASFLLRNGVPGPWELHCQGFLQLFPPHSECWWLKDRGQHQRKGSYLGISLFCSSNIRGDNRKGPREYPHSIWASKKQEPRSLPGTGPSFQKRGEGTGGSHRRPLRPRSLETGPSVLRHKHSKMSSAAAGSVLKNYNYTAFSPVLTPF